MIDDLGYDDLGYVNPDVVSPNIDYLAKNALHIDHYYNQVLLFSFIFLTRSFSRHAHRPEQLL